MTGAADLDALIDELTIDAYNDEEQETGFAVAAQEALVRGEPADLAGRDVEILAIDHGPDVRTGLRATIRADGTRYEIALADLTVPDRSDLAVIIRAYRRWLGWR